MGSWDALPEELARHALSFVWPYTRSYAAARLVCVDWSKVLRKLPKRPRIAEHWEYYHTSTNCGPFGLPQCAFRVPERALVPNFLSRGIYFGTSDSISSNSLGLPQDTFPVPQRAHILDRSIGQLIYYDEIKPEPDQNDNARIEYLKRITSTPSSLELPTWPERLPRLSPRRRVRRARMFADFGFDLMAALEEAMLDAPARAASSRALTVKDVHWGRGGPCM